MEAAPASFVLLCHRGDWEHRYQASAAAAAASSSGREVRVVLFFGALDAMLTDWDREPGPEEAHGGVALVERVEELELASPRELLEAARRSGRCKVLACSASLAVLGRGADELRDSIDEVVGWPTILGLISPPAQVLYL